MDKTRKIPKQNYLAQNINSAKAEKSRSSYTLSKGQRAHLSICKVIQGNLLKYQTILRQDSALIVYVHQFIHMLRINLILG